MTATEQTATSTQLRELAQHLATGTLPTERIITLLEAHAEGVLIMEQRLTRVTNASLALLLASDQLAANALALRLVTADKRSGAADGNGCHG